MAELKVKYIIKGLQPKTLTSAYLINFALQEVADVHYNFEDLTNNFLLDDKEIARLVLDEAEIERLYNVNASLSRAVQNYKDEVKEQAVDFPIDKGNPETISKLREWRKFKLKDCILKDFELYLDEELKEQAKEVSKEYRLFEDEEEGEDLEDYLGNTSMGARNDSEKSDLDNEIDESAITNIILKMANTDYKALIKEIKRTELQVNSLIKILLP